MNAFWHYTCECACADDGKVDSLVGKTVWRSRDASAVTDINSKNGGDASEAGFRNL